MYSKNIFEHKSKTIKYVLGHFVLLFSNEYLPIFVEIDLRLIKFN